MAAQGWEIYIFTGTLLLPVVVVLVCAAAVVPRRVCSSLCAGVPRRHLHLMRHLLPPTDLRRAGQGGGAVAKWTGIWGGSLAATRWGQ
jgi:hypothetical protein